MGGASKSVIFTSNHWICPFDSRGKLFVDGASKIAGFLKISPLLVGLTIVAFGTSSPEATVSILAAMGGSADVAIGNVVGSNIFNITLVVGITAMIFP